MFQRQSLIGFIEFYKAELGAHIERRIFEIYVTDSLQLMGERKYLGQRYADIIYPKEEETRTSDEIISGIFGKLAEG